MRSIRLQGEIAIVPLTKGREALIDAEDVSLIQGRLWRVTLGGDGTIAYAVSGGVASGGVVAMHRILLRAIEGQIIDHINGDGLDNRRSNLRLATHAQNMANRNRTRHRFKGVWQDQRLPMRPLPWRAEIRHNGKTIKLGSFSTAELAARAYDAAAIQLHGEFARTNAMLGLLE